MTKLAALLVALPVVAAAQPAPPSPPPAKTAPLYDRGLVTGPVPGLPGYKLTVTNNANHCGGKKVVVTRPRTKPLADAELAALFDLDPPTGLNFPAEPEKKAERERSAHRFNAFVERMTKTGAAAVEHYSAQFADKTKPEVMFAAAARILQVQLQTARLLVYAEIPKSIRTGELKDEKIEAFCDQMASVVEPIDDRAKEAFGKCQAGVAQFPSTWWAPLCTAP